MTDSQNLFGADAPYGGWKADEAVLSEQKAIPYMIVAVDNADGKREEELTPDIGPVPPAIQAIDGHDFSVRRGIAFARFLKEELDPHIRGKYHICPGRANTIIAGSSSGGLEAFYVGMRYPGTYGCIAALSPAFFLFEEDTWKRFLKSCSLPKRNIFRTFTFLTGRATGWKPYFSAGRAVWSSALFPWGTRGRSFYMKKYRKKSIMKRHGAGGFRRRCDGSSNTTRRKRNMKKWWRFF